MRSKRSKGRQIVIVAQFPPEAVMVSRVAEPESRRLGSRGGTPMGWAHIIVADDDPAVREAIRAALEYLGYRVTDIGDGAAALSAARTDPPHLLVLDLHMPPAGGLAVLQALQEDPLLRAVPVLFLTGSPQDVPPHPGVAAVLAKPLRVEVLAEHLRTILGSEPAS